MTLSELSKSNLTTATTSFLIKLEKMLGFRPPLYLTLERSLSIFLKICVFKKNKVKGVDFPIRARNPWNRDKMGAISHICPLMGDFLFSDIEDQCRLSFFMNEILPFAKKMH